MGTSKDDSITCFKRENKNHWEFAYASFSDFTNKLFLTSIIFAVRRDIEFTFDYFCSSIESAWNLPECEFRLKFVHKAIRCENQSTNGILSRNWIVRFWVTILNHQHANRIDSIHWYTYHVYRKCVGNRRWMATPWNIISVNIDLRTRCVWRLFYILRWRYGFNALSFSLFENQTRFLPSEKIITLFNHGGHIIIFHGTIRVLFYLSPSSILVEQVLFGWPEKGIAQNFMFSIKFPSSKHILNACPRTDNNRCSKWP